MGAGASVDGGGHAAVAVAGAAGAGAGSPSLSSASAASATSSDVSALAQHLRRDLPGHVVDRPLLPGSGRTMRSYRVRHVDSGAVIVVRAMAMRFGPGGAAEGGTGPAAAAAAAAAAAVAAPSGSLGPAPSPAEAPAAEGASPPAAAAESPAPAASVSAAAAAAASGKQLPSAAEVRDDLRRQEAELARLRDALTGDQGSRHPNVLPFLHWFAPSPIPDAAPSYRSAASSYTLPAYLLRPHVHTTLRDRLESRPHLTPVEKGWIAYQILTALDGLHRAGFRHGHLTCENVGLTSWNWVLLLDVATYKPVSVPDDDPSDFITHYQERGGTGETMKAKGEERQRCYLAPERFYARRSGEVPAVAVTEAMDVFSAGCVLIEMFINGERTFDLGDLMEYRTDGSILPGLQRKLNKIESSTMRAGCRHMLSIDPRKRLSAAEYLERLSASPHTARGEGDYGSGPTAVPDTSAEVPTAPVPPCFGSVLFPMMRQLRSHAMSPDARIALAASSYGEVVRETVGLTDAWGEHRFRITLGSDAAMPESGSGGGEDGNDGEAKGGDNSDRAPRDEDRLSESDSLLQKTETLLVRLMEKGVLSGSEKPSPRPNPSRSSIGVREPEQCDDLAERFNKATENGKNLSTSASALIIYVELILNSIRHAQRPSSKLVALQLLSRLSIITTDEMRLQRFVPTVVFLLQDTDASVRASSIVALTLVLSAVKAFPPSDAQLFPQYIFKRVDHLISDPSLMVRDAFAQSIALIAQTAQRFLDVTHAIRMYEMIEGEGGGLDNEVKGGEHAHASAFSDDQAKLLGGGQLEAPPSPSSTEGTRPADVLIQNTYDAELSDLRNTVSRWIVLIATDASITSSLPKRALLRDVARLCNFFGQDGVMTYVLPQALAFLNDHRDWELRAALCQQLPVICSVVGRASTEHFVIPCVETALIDSNEKVICSALSCLSIFVKLALITRGTLIGVASSPTVENRMGLIEKYLIFLVHPSAEIRAGYIALLCCTIQAIGIEDALIFLLPKLQSFLRFEPDRAQIETAEGLSECLVSPMSRAVLTRELTGVAANLPAAGGSEPNFAPSLFTGDDDEAVDEHIRSIMDLDSAQHYLEMLYKKKRASRAHVLSADEGEATEGAWKYSYSCFAPNQKLAELMRDPLPEWYENMRQLANSNPNFSSERSSLRCLTTLTKAYGLAITQPSNSFENKPNHYAFLDMMLGDDVPHHSDGSPKDADAKLFLSSDESSIFEASARGVWGAVLRQDPVLDENSNHAAKTNAMAVPPLPPSLGVLREQGGRPFSCHLATSKDPSLDTTRQGEWKPKVDALVASSSPTSEHTDAVTRLALSQDQSFFVTGSHDGTSRVFELRQVEESVGDLRSCLAYTGHCSNSSAHSLPRINDVTIIENSHSVASAASNGSVHIWKVDQVSSRRASRQHDHQSPTRARHHDFARVSGSSLVRTIDPREGEVLAISHFNTDVSSMVVFGTQKGTIHTWDIRCAAEPFAMNLRPEFGYLTSMAVGHDRHWMVTGTNRGCLALWDIRYQKVVKLWQHSSAAPISRLATSFTALRPEKGYSEAHPHVFMGCGLNEVSVFDVFQGNCKQCFRVLDSNLCYVDQSALSPDLVSLPQLHEVAIPSRSQRPLFSSAGTFDCLPCNERITPPEPRISSLIGRLGTGGQNFLITGGTDCNIRYWSFSSSSKCYTVSGLGNCQPRPAYESVDVGPSAKLYLCRQMPVARHGDMESRKLPRKLQRGQVRPENCHLDDVLDLKLLDKPSKGLLSCSRDSTVCIWR